MARILLVALSLAIIVSACEKDVPDPGPERRSFRINLCVDTFTPAGASKTLIEWDTVLPDRFSHYYPTLTGQEEVPLDAPPSIAKVVRHCFDYDLGKGERIGELSRVSIPESENRLSMTSETWIDIVVFLVQQGVIEARAFLRRTLP